MATGVTALEIIRNIAPKAFVSKPHYFADGDFLTYFINDRECVAERVNELLTIYVDEQTGDLVGCKVKGIAKLMLTIRRLSIDIDDGKTRLGLLFLSLVANSSDKEKQEVLDKTDKFKNVPWPPELNKLAA